ncbi:MAG: PorT family protein [Nonlabens sp.]|nr:PorT family protein [Nonlabens sp.]MDP5102098.1 PorT family protein [Nonlabens sp.]
MKILLMYICAMKMLAVLIFIIGTSVAFGQKSEQTVTNVIPNVVDSLYREDQIYISLAFNLINNEPTSFSQNGFSGGFHIGFIRDMPFNKRRNKAIGIGFGLGRSTYNTNLLIGETVNGTTSFSIIEDVSGITRNRFITNQLEVPIQYRWRTSTPTEHTFWRIHAGAKVSYVFSHVAKYQDRDGSFRNRNISELDLLRYAASLTVGNGSFNAFVQYDLNPLFNSSARVNGEAVNLQPIKFGVEFYLL